MLEEPEKKQRDHLHAHHADECAAEAASVGRVIFGLGHGRQYASGNRDDTRTAFKKGRCSNSSRIIRIIQIRVGQQTTHFQNAFDQGLGSDDAGAFPSAAIRLRKIRAAPGTPDGSWRKSASVL